MVPFVGDRRILTEKGVFVASFPRLPELEGFVLLLGLQVVDDELLAAVVAVAEDGSLVVGGEFF